MLIFASGVVGLAVMFTPRHGSQFDAMIRPAPSATPTKLGFFDPIPKTIVHSADSLTIPRGPSGHFVTTATINGHLVDAIVDTGASTVALSIDDARAAGLSVDPSSFTVVGQGASGPVRGQRVTLNEVDVGGRQMSGVDGVVLEGLQGTLLGQSYLRRLDSVEIKGDTMELR